MTSLPNSVIQRSFYRRALPPSCTALSSKEGKTFFQSALRHEGLKSFFPLIEQFTTQSEPAYCGVSTLVMVLNALAVDPRRTWKGPWRWYTESMLNCCMDLEEMKQTGITLRTFSCLAKCQGLEVTTRFASDIGLSDFRNAVRLACIEDSSTQTEDTVGPFLTVSYDRKVIQQTGSGHFSPIAAYDEGSDHVLILDTARFKYGAHWVKLPLVFEAMQSTDPVAGKSRGFVLLSFHQDEEHSTMPFSLLFRTRQADNGGARQCYKKWLQTRDRDTAMSWEDAVSYWTQEGRNPKDVWLLTETQLLPTEEKDQEAISAVQDLIRELIPSSPLIPAFQSDCHANANRTICLSAFEAIFVVYLASLDVKSRNEIILETKTCASHETKQQLTSEAELLKLAIEMSEDFVQ